MLEILVQGIQEVFHLSILIKMFIGVAAGITAGAIPGFTITMAIVLTLPFTFGMSPIQGVTTMVGVFIGGLSGGLITAGLLGIPGTPSAVATTFDAFPMVKKGEPGRALGIGIWSSFFGSLISMILLITIAPQVANLAMKIGPWEYFSLVVFGLTIIASVTGDSIVKGLIAGCFGLLIATVGVDPMSGVPRFIFGIENLGAGIPFLTVLIGVFAVSRLLTELEVNEEDEEQTTGIGIDSNIKFAPLESAKEVLSQPVNLIRSSIIGAFIGAIPGAGASISNILAYDQAKKASKHPEKFGTGIADGVIASESGNNSTAGGGLIPMIALGIPGSAVSAVMLAALMVHGINPGPMLIKNNPDVVGSIFVSFFVATVFMLIIQFVGARLFLKITKIPKYLLVPTILSLCVIGAYVLNNRFSDLYILFVMGIIGYILKKYNFALAPVILGVILGPIAETNLRRALMTSPDWSLFFTRPISVGFLILGVLSIIYAIWQNNKSKQVAEKVSA
ncbi:tripartite tricarboxylate transporter permease [Selenihalanaerobacter shriftii]|uniref:Putative tricarboxylic transport membrane protein n=1 Tax=Selenihalanaerobacter shriftii TaxID=142842 RepID=A0A1T4MWE7_9FIRM|nr:tripartite tricarboxylate transporter permease [Selenihalanaerobacter shriftii]SJZ70968.1 putative tricarboxylic transport membrane protein [Selenihalanaerobacter shriftii]